MFELQGLGMLAGFRVSGLGFRRTLSGAQKSSFRGLHRAIWG